MNDSKKTDEGTTTFAGVTFAGTLGGRRFKVSAGDKKELLEVGSRLKVNVGTGSPVVKRFWPIAREWRLGRVVIQSGREPVNAFCSKLSVPRLAQPGAPEGRLPDIRLWLRSINVA